jgi:hypothetical protein
MVMRRALPLVALAFLGSAEPFGLPSSGARIPERMSVYEHGVAGTIVPASLLRAIALVESDGFDWATSPDGKDIGRFQLRELYHEERAAKWGEYDPRKPLEAGAIAAKILEANFRELGDWDLATAAYRQGVTGVRRDGPTEWYLERVGAVR